MFFKKNAMDAYKNSDSPNNSMPEKRLLIRMIENAARDWSHPSGYKPDYIKQEAHTWLLMDGITEEDVEKPESFSFPWICEMLEIDVYQMQDLIKKAQPFLVSMHLKGGKRGKY